MHMKQLCYPYHIYRTASEGWGKVMFSQVSVCQQGWLGGGGGLIPSPSHNTSAGIMFLPGGGGTLARSEWGRGTPARSGLDIPPSQVRMEYPLVRTGMGYTPPPGTISLYCLIILIFIKIERNN